MQKSEAFDGFGVILSTCCEGLFTVRKPRLDLYSDRQASVNSFPAGEPELNGVEQLFCVVAPESSSFT